jgi:hypothetical protein
MTSSDDGQQSRIATAPLRQRDITRALRAAHAAGLKIAGYEIDATTGRIIVTIINEGSVQELTTPLDKWMADHASEA